MPVTDRRPPARNVGKECNIPGPPSVLSRVSLRKRGVCGRGDVPAAQEGSLITWFCRNCRAATLPRVSPHAAWLASAVVLIATGQSSASYMTTVQASNPASYYRLEETSGTSAADLGTRNLPATYS